MIFFISGHIKPYVRMTQRGKFSSVQALQYFTSRQDMQYQLKEQMIGEMFNKTPLKFTAIINTRIRKGDTDNIIKAILDAMKGIVFNDDLWIDEIDVKRIINGRDYAQLEIEVISEEMIKRPPAVDKEFYVKC